MRYITFALLFKYEQGLIVFNTISSNYSKCKSPFTPKSVMNKPQAEGKVNSRLYSRPQEKKVQHSSAIKNNEAQLLVYLKSFLLISMIELDHQRSAAKTLVNKMGLDTFALFNIFNYCRFASYSEFAFHCFNSFWWILNLFFYKWDELMYIHI